MEIDNGKQMTAEEWTEYFHQKAKEKWKDYEKDWQDWDYLMYGEEK